jgi:hypothetical protein
MTATGQGRENSGRQIRLFLVDGTPSGVMKAEIVNWTGKALAAPRARFADLVHCEESCRTGIYVLIGPDPDRANGLKCYIGEADHVGKRLPRHADDDDKDFFDRVAFVVSKDENLTKAHVRYLESQLIRMTREAGSVQLANGTEPEFALLPEADRSDMAFFLGQLRIVLPILGIDLFRPDQAASSLRGEAAQSPIFELQSVDASASSCSPGRPLEREGPPASLRDTAACAISWSPMASWPMMATRNTTASQSMWPSPARVLRPLL